jgi:hypothetical protein
MPTETKIEVRPGEDVALAFAPAHPGATVAGWTLDFEVKAARDTSLAALIQKTTTGGGITVTGAAAGEFTVALASADTKTIRPDLYYWELARTDTGSRQVLAFGQFVLTAHVILFS